MIFLQYNIIPMGIQSLKVFAELPIIVVLMYQMYKQQVQNDMMEFIPLIMNTITLQPSAQHRYVVQCYQLKQTCIFLLYTFYVSFFLCGGGGGWRLYYPFFLFFLFLRLQLVFMGRVEGVIIWEKK